ncbi:MAG: lipid-A-disaccharide synthase [Bdellovibrionota bacterium]
MELFVSAGEASSDIHCAHLIRELGTLVSGRDLKVFGLGGDQLAAQGAQLMMHNREFSVGGGPLEVISKLPKRKKLEKLLEKRLFEKLPDGAILVDNGEINLRLASMLHFFGVPVVYFIPPKVWVWRPERIELIAQHVKLVLSILPFERKIYEEWEVPFEYVGNPLVDEVSSSLTEAQAKELLGIDPRTEVLTVMPGSRHNEVRYHGDLFARAIAEFLEKLPPSQAKPVVVVPVAQAIEISEVEQVFQKHLSNVKCVKGMSHECLRAARAALVKSGTSTLEAALLGTPMVLAYQSSRSSALFYRHVVRYRGFVGLVNLFLAEDSDAALGWGEKVSPTVPELILEECTPEKIRDELLRVYQEGPYRKKMERELARTRDLLLPPRESGTSPLKAAARAALKLFTR